MMEKIRMIFSDEQGSTAAEHAAFVALFALALIMGLMMFAASIKFV